jgi:predicted Zn-dependent protease
MAQLLGHRSVEKNGRFDLLGQWAVVTFALLLVALSLAHSARAQRPPSHFAERMAGDEPLDIREVTSPALENSQLPSSSHVVDRPQHALSAGRSIGLHTLERDRQTGALLSRDIDAHNKMITDPQVLNFHNHLGQSLIDSSRATLPFAITIKLIESHEISAFTLPGGYVYVSSGLIIASNSEAEIAGILAHEIAHIAERHDPRMQRRRRKWSIAAHCSGPAGVAVQFAGFLASMKASRDAEREADFLGIQYLIAADTIQGDSSTFFNNPSLRGKRGTV